MLLVKFGGDFISSGLSGLVVRDLAPVLLEGGQQMLHEADQILALFAGNLVVW
jgi:hypothetical protein